MNDFEKAIVIFVLIALLSLVLTYWFTLRAKAIGIHGGKKG